MPRSDQLAIATAEEAISNECQPSAELRATTDIGAPAATIIYDQKASLCACINALGVRVSLFTAVILRPLPNFDAKTRNGE